MNLTTVQLKKIIKEELMKEMDVQTGLAAVGGAFLAYKGLSYLVAIFQGAKEGIETGLREASFAVKMAGELLRDPKILSIIEKLKDQEEIKSLLQSGKIDEASKLIEKELLTDEEKQIVEEKFRTASGLVRTHSRAVRMKYGIENKPEYKKKGEK